MILHLFVRCTEFLALPCTHAGIYLIINISVLFFSFIFLPFTPYFEFSERYSYYALAVFSIHSLLVHTCEREEAESKKENTLLLQQILIKLAK